MPIEGYNGGTPDLYPRGSDKCLSHLTSSPRICRACRPTTRRHFAHTAIAMLCEMAKRRLLRCPVGLPGSALPCAVSPSVLLGHRSARGGSRAAVLDWRRVVGRQRRTVARPIWGWGALGRGIEHASNSPRRLRAIEHASRYPPRRAPSDKSGAKNTGVMELAAGERQVMDRQAGQDAHASPQPKTRQCRAPDQRAVKATCYAGGRIRPTWTAAGGAHA
jgi:hypothetical protein